jgi:hypothetical protein
MVLSVTAVTFFFLQFAEIQRAWSSLEPLFIGSEEVRKELPEDAIRFEVSSNCCSIAFVGRKLLICCAGH